MTQKPGCCRGVDSIEELAFEICQLGQGGKGAGQLWAIRNSSRTSVEKKQFIPALQELLVSYLS